jgi:DNA-directed RNA polymerase subunit F
MKFVVIAKSDRRWMEDEEKKRKEANVHVRSLSSMDGSELHKVVEDLFSLISMAFASRNLFA